MFGPSLTQGMSEYFHLHSGEVLPSVATSKRYGLLTLLRKLMTGSRWPGPGPGPVVSGLLPRRRNASQCSARGCVLCTPLLMKEEELDAHFPAGSSTST